MAAIPAIEVIEVMPAKRLINKGAGFEQRECLPTKRTNPIMAESKTPAPSDFILPSLVGFNKVPESRKRTAASFSMGKQSTIRNETVGPGPAKYDVTGLGTKGRVVPRKSSMGIKPEPLKAFRTPAPGDFDVTKADKSVLQSSGLVRGFTFGHPISIMKTSSTPAPNEYKIPSVLGHSKEGQIKSAPAYSLVSRRSQAPDSRLNYPAPGWHDIEFGHLRCEPPHYSMGRIVGVRQSIGPAPGAYAPEKVTANYPSVPACTFGIKHTKYLGNTSGIMIPPLVCTKIYKNLSE